MSTKNDILGVTMSGRTIPGVAPGIAGAGVGAGAAVQQRPTEPSTTPGAPILNDGAQNGQKPQTTVQTQQAKPAGQPVVQPQQQATQAQQQAGQPQQQQATQQKAADVSKAGAETQQPTPSDKQTTWEGMERYGTPRNDNPDGIVTPYAPGTQVDKEHPYKQSTPSDGWSESFKKANPQLLDEDGNVDPQKLQNYTNEQLYDYLEKVKKENPDETPEEKKKRLRREKWKKIIAAIGDGVSSLANLYYTTKGAPNGYDSKTKLSDAYQARLDKLNEERQKRHEELLNAYQKQYAMASGMASNDEKKKLNNMRILTGYQNAQIRAQKAEKEAEILERKGDVLGAQAKRIEAQTALDEARRIGVELDNGNKPQEYKDAHDVARSTVAKNESTVTKNYAQAAKTEKSGGGSSGGGKGSGKPYATLNGVPYASKADYERAVVSYAKEHGIPLQYKKKGGVGGTTETTTNRTIAGLASDVEAHYRKTHAQTKQQPKQAQKPQPKAGKGTQSRGTAAAHRTAGAKQRSSARARAAAQAKAAGF